MKIFSFIGNSNSGKTTLITKIIAELKRRNYSVGAVKHSPKGFDIDRKGKDSFRLKEGGADPLLIISQNNIALFKKDNKDSPREIIKRYFSHKDFVIIEGGKSWKGINKIEVIGNENNRLKLNDSPVAVVSDKEIDEEVPVFKKDDIKEIVDFMVKTQTYE